MNCLEPFIAAARERSRYLRRETDLPLLEEMARCHQPKGFQKALSCTAQIGPAIIAELKRASPSQGMIRHELMVAELARQLRQAGATAFSVVTEERIFRGSLADLATTSAVGGLPCLCKDFVVDEVQLIEARAHSADAVLLILAALSQSEFHDLLAMARVLDLDVVCEVHDEMDLDRALEEGVEMIGVNSRNLRDLSINLKAFDLIEKIPESIVTVAESGIADGVAIRVLRDRGYHAFLIGNALMQAQNPGEKLKKLLAEAARPPAILSTIGRGA